MPDRLFDVRSLPAGALVIPGWERFQHYKDRNPPWIKTYTELLSDEAYLQLSGHRRAILHGLWLEYARSNCRLSLDTRTLTRRLGLKVSSSDLQALHDAGFITAASHNHAALPGILASAPLAERTHPASTPLAPHARARTRSQEAEAEKTERKTSAVDLRENGTAEEVVHSTGLSKLAFTPPAGAVDDDPEPELS
jgi:hypothetical protein